MELKSDHLNGAKQIIRRCLGLSQGQYLVIFVDETTIDVGVVLAEAADLLEVPQTTILVPTSLQRRIPAERDLSLLTQGITKEARAILTCVNGLPECLPFRERILETQWSARTRIGHMPGATINILELANIDFNQLISDCRNIELAMARGRTLEFISFASDGQTHCLTVDIGAWERLPVASDGVISDGVWGNVPSGETYIAPIEGSGEGSLVINGSIPDLVVESGYEIVLYFEQGRLTHIEPSDNPTARWLRLNQIQKAQDQQDSNWSNLAEIGVGVNSNVKNLTGNMLFDEKCAGTAHIALGSNTFMGGSVKSAIHCDMVVKSPTIFIDGKTILDRGRLRFIESEWRENHSQISLDKSPLSKAVSVARSGTQTESYGRQLQRILHSEPGRVSACFVGDDETSQMAYFLCTYFPEDGDWITVENLADNSKMDSETVRRVLHIMWDYSLVKLH